MSGRLIRTPLDYWAYIPGPLEPAMDFDLALIRTNSAADRAISELAGIARTLPNPHLLIGPFIRREAVLSSKIEGTQASFSDLLFFEAASMGEDKVPDVREVLNYVHALEYGISRLDVFPLSLRLIRDMHEKLLTGVRGSNQTPGEFRHSQNWIGPPGCALMDAAYVPPPEEEMKNGLLFSFVLLSTSPGTLSYARISCCSFGRSIAKVFRGLELPLSSCSLWTTCSPIQC